MPYKIDLCGIYRIVNHVTGQCYVGQSRRMQKRIKEHFRLLRWNQHPNRRLQESFNQYGEASFYGAIEVQCETVEELDALEEAFLNGEAWFDEPTVFNISDFAKAPMRGKRHSTEIRERIRLGRRAATFNYQSPEYKQALSKAQMARYHADPKFVAKLKFILDNPDWSYAARARHLNTDTSSVRKLALKYHHLKGAL